MKIIDIEFVLNIEVGLEPNDYFVGILCAAQTARKDNNDTYPLIDPDLPITTAITNSLCSTAKVYGDKYCCHRSFYK